jgi:hydroxymethylpyrimidine pyrophosphatase-like HAD family hydrolase
LLISGIIIGILYVTVLLKHTASSSLACIIFLGIMFSSDGESPLFTSLNRLIDTAIGIIVSYLINGVWTFRKPNLKTLFVMNYDGVLAGADGSLSNYAKINLNRLLEKKAAITIASHRSPAVLLPELKDVRFNLPVIVMNGAVVYDIKEHTILYCVSIPQKLVRTVIDISAAAQRNADTDIAPDIKRYTYGILHDEIHVFYEELTPPAAEGFYKGLISRIYQSYVRGYPPKEAEILYFFYSGEDSGIRRIEEKVRALPQSEMLSIIREDDLYRPGFSNLEITAAGVSILAAARWLMEREGYTSLAAFGRGEADIPLLTAADKGFAMKGAIPEVQALGLPNGGSPTRDDAVRKIQTLFYQGKGSKQR